MNKELPKDWKWVKLGEAMQVLDNLRKPINSSERQQRIAGKREKELYPYYGATGQVGWIDGFLTNGEYVLVGEDGAPFLDIFKEKAYKIKGKTWVNNHAHILKELSRVTINDFILHYLNSINYRHYVNGTTRLKLTKGSLVEIPFPLPSINTQQAIVAKIEELFSEIENGIKSLFTALRQLKTYRQSVLKWAFEGKLTEEWREKEKISNSKDLIAEIIKQRELKYTRNLENWNKKKSNPDEEKISKPQRPSNLDPKNDLFEGLVWKENIPVDWEIVPLVFVSDNQPNSIVDGPFGSSINVNEDYIDSGVPVIRMVNIRPFRFVQNQMKFIRESKFQSLRRHNILPGDILIAKVGATIGDCCIYPINQPEAMLSTTGSCRVRLDKDMMNAKFLEYNIFFHRNTLKDIASQTAQPFLNMKVLKSFPIVLPTIEEQNKIIQEIESRLSVADKMEESINQSLQQAEALRQSILKKAFEGRLT
jgi:type I restriction enzyme S subunit